MILYNLYFKLRLVLSNRTIIISSRELDYLNDFHVSYISHLRCSFKICPRLSYSYIYVLSICILWYMHGIRHRRIFLKHVEKKFRCWTNITYTQLHHSHLYNLKLHHRQNLYRHKTFCHGIQTPWLDQHKLKTKKKKKILYRRIRRHK